MFFPPPCDHPCHWRAAVGVIRQWQAKRGVTALTDPSSCYVIVNPQPSARSRRRFHPPAVRRATGVEGGGRVAAARRGVGWGGGINMTPSYFYISKRSQAAVFSLSGEGLSLASDTQLGASNFFQMRTSQQRRWRRRRRLPDCPSHRKPGPKPVSQPGKLPLKASSSPGFGSPPEVLILLAFCLCVCVCACACRMSKSTSANSSETTTRQPRRSSCGGAGNSCN